MDKNSIYLTIQIDLMLHLTGTYECKIDAKGRLMLPAALKKQLLPEIEDGFVLKRAVFDQCLELYPMSEWKEMMLKINKLNRFKKKNNDFIRRFTAGVKIIEVDAAGRLLVPKDLFNFAELQKEVVLSSQMTIVELWDKKKYEQVIGNSADDFASLAEEVMGDRDEQL